MIRVWLPIAVGAASLCAAPVVGATNTDRPPRVGPVYSVPTDQRVALRVWRTTEGYCVSPDRVSLNRVSCVPSTWLRTAGPTFTWLSRGPGGTRLVVGIAKQRVRRGQVEDRRGTAPVPLYEAPAGLRTSLRFFRAVVRTGAPPKWRVRFYDGRDNVVGSVGHGLKDFWQHRTHFVANTRWWPPFWLVVDGVVAAIIAVEIVAGVHFAGG